MEDKPVKRLFVFFLLIMLIVMLPVVAMAAGEDLGDYIGPEVGVGISLLFVVGLVLADTVLGGLVAKKQGEFDWALLPQFLGSGILIYVGGLLVLASLAYLMPFILPQTAGPLGGIFYTAAVTVAIKYFADLKDKVKLLFGVQLE